MCFSFSLHSWDGVLNWLYGGSTASQILKFSQIPLCNCWNVQSSWLSCGRLSMVSLRKWSTRGGCSTSMLVYWFYWRGTALIRWFSQCLADIKHLSRQQLPGYWRLYQAWAMGISIPRWVRLMDDAARCGNDSLIVILLYHLVNSHITMERSSMFNGKIHYFYGHVQ